MTLDPSKPVIAYVHGIYADPTVERRRYLRLVIHPDTDDLVRAGNARNRKIGSRQDLAGSAGLFQPSRLRSRYDRHLRRWIDTTGPFAGIMRLARGYLTGEVITHESAHAALHIWRMHDWAQTDGAGEVQLGDVCDETEEHFAHLLSGIAGTVNDIVLQYLEATKGEA